MHNRANHGLAVLAAAVAVGMALAIPVARGDGVYSVAPQTLDGGGSRATSASYTVDGSIGGVGGAVSTAATLYLTRQGYAGQLTDPVGLALGPESATIAETGTRQLLATTVNDDDTLTALAGTEVVWSVVDGPVAEIDAAGLATAGVVYEDTPATVRGQWNGSDETLLLSVLDTLRDNYGLYAADEIDDGWQVRFYGLDNPHAAPGYNPFGTGDNLFKFYADLDPTDEDARFHLAIQSVPGEPEQKDLVFSPLAAGRVYTLFARTNLTRGGWAALESASVPVIAGDQATVTDLDAAENAKFYRVQIEWPR